MLWEINFVVGSICVYIEQYKFTFQLKCVYYLRLYDLDPVTLILKLDLDITKMYLCTK